MNNSEASALLTEKLGLGIVPVALKFMDSAPSDIETIQETVPSACRFWREAERRTFFAPADAHFNCPVGAMVMGFDLPEAVSEELMELVGQMTKCGYLAADEPGRIPVNAKQGTKGVLYGPLSAFPGTPDAVLLWLTPAEAMILSEATGGAHWGNDQPATAFGRHARPSRSPRSRHKQHCPSAASACAPSPKSHPTVCWWSCPARFSTPSPWRCVD
jgi:uncharacterized protein (DUF169 family)